MLGFENVSWNGSSGSVNKARRKCHFAHVKLLVTFPLKTVRCSSSPLRPSEWKREPCQEVSFGTRMRLTDLPVKNSPEFSYVTCLWTSPTPWPGRKGARSDLSELVVWWGWDLAKLRSVYRSGSVKEEMTCILWKLPGKSGQGWKMAFWELGQEEGWRRFPGQEGLELRWEEIEWFSAKKLALALREVGLCDFWSRESWARGSATYWRRKFGAGAETWRKGTEHHVNTVRSLGEGSEKSWQTVSARMPQIWNSLSKMQ